MKYSFHGVIAGNVGSKWIWFHIKKKSDLNKYLQHSNWLDVGAEQPICQLIFTLFCDLYPKIRGAQLVDRNLQVDRKGSTGRSWVYFKCLLFLELVKESQKLLLWFLQGGGRRQPTTTQRLQGVNHWWTPITEIPKFIGMNWRRCVKLYLIWATVMSSRVRTSLSQIHYVALIWG